MGLSLRVKKCGAIVFFMERISVTSLAKAIKVLEDGYKKVLLSNTEKYVTLETLVWTEYFVKKMLLVLADVERGKAPFDMDIDL